MPTRVIVNGANGKMGQFACSALTAAPDFELVAQLSREDSLQQAITALRPDIVVDLTCADTVFSNTSTIIESGARPVIGTSGLTPEQIALLTTRINQKQSGGIIVPNFSIAAVLMMRMAAEAARYLPDVEIIESHHTQKYDAPSGTALKTAELIAQARTNAPSAKTGHESLPGVRGGQHQGIPIHSVRLPGILARQEIWFGSPGETLQLTHNSLDRSCFMPGLLLCCKKVLHLNTLYYGLEHVLDFS